MGGDKSRISYLVKRIAYRAGIGVEWVWIGFDWPFGFAQGRAEFESWG